MVGLSTIKVSGSQETVGNIGAYRTYTRSRFRLPKWLDSPNTKEERASVFRILSFRSENNKVSHVLRSLRDIRFSQPQGSSLFTSPSLDRQTV